jgi:hypothetical protein
MARTKYLETQFGHRFYTLLHDRWQLPWAYSVRIVRGAKALKNPLDYARRKTAARRLRRGASAFASRISRADGYWLFGPDELPGAKAAAAECARIFDDLQAGGSVHDLRNNSKKHLRVLVKGEDFAKYPAIGSFVTSPAVLEAATGYFGSAPILCSIGLLWSVTNDSVISSQKFHLDGEDVSQLKLFLNVWDLDNEHGPLTFYPASSTERILQNADRNVRLNAGIVGFEDSFVLPASDGRQPIRLVGPAGTGVFVDTSRCMHFGSRKNSRERLMLMVQFARSNLARESAVELGSTDWIAPEQNGELQRFALGR